MSEKWVILKHGFRNAMIPVVTMMGLQFGPAGWMRLSGHSG
ncbi:glutathione ABC transporter, permease protein GsiC domain protein [Enterobacter hormaechei subsp. xiangfangensis]|nr:glutathione ABC transporter, permease protein GsiC domain protein [Enterobacter hormaechei subsp. xiangfangensis]